jgi:transcriptional regulator with XRE-family HTH domain
LLTLLREARQAAGLTQVGLAAALGRSLSLVSKAEVGETRLDVVQLRSICQALRTTLPTFVARLEERLTNRGKRKGAGRRKGPGRAGT